MGNINIMYMLDDIEERIDIIKTIFVMICTYYSYFKITNQKIKLNIKNVLYNIVIVVTYIVFKYEFNKLGSVICIILLESIMFSRKNIGYGMLTSTISLTINYTVLAIAIIINYIVNYFIGVSNNYTNLAIILIIHLIILYNLFKIKRFKYGISFLKNKQNNEFVNLFILNVSVTILFTIIIIVNADIKLAMDATVGLIVIVIIMSISVQKSLQLYYKQKLLIQDLNETKEELETTRKELKQVEEENLSLSKKSHSIAHKQKALEYKMQQLLANAEVGIDEVGEVQDRIKEIEKDLYKDKVVTQLTKIEIPNIDDMLQYMQFECVKNKIEFELQISGNIHYMINNLISKEDLEILLADHIKDAIIAVNHTDNINRSILVRLGEIDGIYSLYIYDSGIEFEKETLAKLGKMPITTHANEGGTGMGFMNTFDTLKKYKASLTINELSEPNKDNYTKVLIFKFDKKSEFKIISYRS